MSTPGYMKAYTWRIIGFMTAYVAILTAGLTLEKSYELSTSLRIALAFATALPICGVFWALFRVLVECDDEYQRFLLVKQVLAGTAATLVIVTIWNFLEVYDVVTTGPQWVGAIWLAMFGLAAPIVRWRA